MTRAEKTKRMFQFAFLLVVLVLLLVSYGEIALQHENDIESSDMDDLGMSLMTILHQQNQNETIGAYNESDIMMAFRLLSLQSSMNKTNEAIHEFDGGSNEEIPENNDEEEESPQEVVEEAEEIFLKDEEATNTLLNEEPTLLLY